MALIKDNKYYRICEVNINYQSVAFANILMEKYDSEADRIKTKTGEEYLVKDKTWFSVNDVNVSGNVDIREKAYEEIKKLPEFTGAIDA